MTLRCANCGSYELTITSKSYSRDTALESYRCEDCGARGSHYQSAARSEFTGQIESDDGGGVVR